MALINPMVGPLTQAFGPTSFTMEPPLTWHGTYYAHFHEGIDIGGPIGMPVHAAANGYVREVGWDISLAIGGGIGIWLQHGSALHTVYAHLSQELVSQGQQVVAGQTIGLCGDTGNVTGPHLHFGVWTVTQTWGFALDDPADFLLGGVSADTTPSFSDDIPSLEPLSGTLVRGALCIPTGTGRYALPSAASQVGAVYFDKLRVSPAGYTVEGSNGNLYVRPIVPLSDTVEVRADYIT